MYLDEVIDGMDFYPEISGTNYKIFDDETLNYLSKDDNSNEYSSIQEIIDRLELFIHDYWFRELEEELSKLGYNSSIAWEYLFEEGKKHRKELSNEIFNDEYFETLDCFIHPDKFEGVIKPNDKKTDI